VATELPTVDLELTEEQEAALLRDVEEQLAPAMEAHLQREQRLARLRMAYKAKPEVEKKTFPWPGASNVVIPIVGITVDNIVARLMRSFLGMPDPIEAQILEGPQEFQEKDFRDWAKAFLKNSGARDTLRTMFHDMAIDGTAFVKVRWDSVIRTVHSYGAEDGAVSATEITDYEGPVWDAIQTSDMVWPEGFDSYKRLPWAAHVLRLTWQELCEARDKGMYTNVDEQLKARSTDRGDSPNYRVTQKTSGVDAKGSVGLYTLLEIWGKWEIPQEDPEAPPVFADVILTYSPDDRRFHRKINNPFFGNAMHIVRVPFLHQPHEIEGMGAAEQVHQFQIEASTAHNQTIDAATAAIAGIVIRKPSTQSMSGKEIYPGAEFTADDPKNDFTVVHLSMGNSSLPNVEQQAAFWAEKRSGVSAYSMGVESQIAGSRATATGTTALIAEGNQRFWVSIDDMRDSIIDLLFLTLQIEQQLRPQGIPLSASRVLQLPQGDLRTVLGLTLSVSSEKVNRDLEIQSFQMLTQMLNEYYMRLMQAAALVMNPQFPPGQKLMAMAVMNASNNLMKRLVERFDIQNIDELVPGLGQALQMIGGALGPNAMAVPPGGGQGMLPPGSPGGGGAVPPQGPPMQ
jgi:hypothetical protein